MQQRPDPDNIYKHSGDELQVQQRIAFASGLLQGDLTIRTLLESLAEGVVVIDKGGTILLVNARAEAMFGYEKSEMIGKPHDIVLPLRFHDIHKQHMSRYFNEPKIRPMGMGLDLIACRKDASEFPVEISLSFMETADNFFVIAFVSDITRRKQVEQELKERNQALDAFAHTLAHDIKNSIAVMTGFSQNLEQFASELTPEEIAESAKMVAKTGGKIHHVIDELLRFSTISREEIKLMPVNMTEVLSSVMERLKPSIQEHNGQVKIQDEFPLSLGHAGWIEEIWYNYISNALKYGGEPPVVDVGATEEPGGKIRFWVKDNGKGLTELQMVDIFNSYESRKEKSQKGHGLGLSIVRRIAEKLNGEVRAENSPDGGALFSFTLAAMK